MKNRKVAEFLAIMLFMISIWLIFIGTVATFLPILVIVPGVILLILCFVFIHNI
jgi:hypothetical protein